MFKVQSQLPAVDDYDEIIADISPIPLLLTDGNGSGLHVNASWVQLTGLERNHSLGTGWLEAIAPSDIDKLYNYWADTTNFLPPHTLDLCLHNQKHESLWVQMTSRVMVDSFGAVIRVNAFSDMSTFMGLSSALAQNRDDFRLLAEAMPGLVWSADPAGMINYCNGAWLTYTGLGLSDMEQGRFTEILHPDDINETRKLWMEALRTGQGFEMQYRLLAKTDQSYKWFIARSTPLHDAEGRLIRWVGTATDIDEQKRSAEKLDFIIEAAHTFASTLNLQAICNELSSLAVKRFCDWSFVLLLDENSLISTYSVAHQAVEQGIDIFAHSKGFPPENRGILAQVFSSNTPFLKSIISNDDIIQLATSPEHFEILKMLKIFSLMILPLSTDSGKVYGAVVLISSESRRIFKKGDVEIAELVARQATVAIQKARVYQAERIAAQNLRFIAEASEILFDSFDVQAALQKMLSLLVEEICDFAVILRIDNKTHLRCVAVAHNDPTLDHQANTLLSERPFTTETEHDLLATIENHKPFITEHIENSWFGFWEFLIPELQPIELLTSISIPLFYRGITYGALVAYYTSLSNRTYRDWDLYLFTDLGRRASIAIEKALVYTRERRIAETLQQSLLPPSLPLIAGLNFCAEYVPSSNEVEIGGDWYDAFALKDGTIVLSVGDVIGRGLKAASIMGLIRQAIGVMAMTEQDPATVLNSIDYLFCQYFPDSIATAFVAFVDLKAKTLSYANAGHPFAILRISDTLVELNGSQGLPLGLRNEFGFNEPSSQVAIDNVQLLVMYTDGLVESTQNIIEGEQRLHAALSTDAILHVREQARLIRDICTVKPYQDDVAILTMRFDNGEHWSFDAENARAAHDSRAEFVRYLEKHAADPQSIPLAELIFGELIGNVVRHAPGPIDVHLDWHEVQPVLHVIDRGNGIIGTGELPNNPLSEGGRGLFIIKAICVAFTVERIEGYGNHVAVVLPINRKTA